MDKFPEILFAATAAFVGGIVLLLTGLRGRRIGDHSFCRRCGYDLFGRPPDTQRSPECGGDLGKARAMIVGQRQRRRGLIWLGLALMAPGLALLGVAGVIKGRGIDSIHYVPVSWLVHDARSDQTAVANAALNELLRRQANGALSNAQLNRVADAALVAQADLSKIWHPQWGDFVERTQAQGALSETKMRQYLQHIPVFALKARPSIQHGHPLPFEIVTAAGRAGSNSHYGLVWTTNRIEVSGRSRSIDELVSDDASLIGAINDSEISYANRFGELAFTDHLSLAPWEPMLEGPQTLKVFLTVDVTGPAPLKSSASMIKSSAPTTLDVAWTLLPRGTLAARLVHDDSLRPVVENSLRLPRFNREFFDVQCSAPINLAYDVFARSGSREYRLGTMLYRGKSNTSDMTQYSLPPDLKGDRADVIFRPSLDAAETTVDIQQIWDGEVVIKDVPIKQ